MRGYYLFGLVLLLLVSAPFVVSEFSVDVVTLEDSILPGQSARFEFQITNLLPAEDRYIITSNEYSYLTFVDERPVVGPDETGSYFVEISPRSFVNYGTHRTPITVRSRDSGRQATVSPIIFLRNPDSTPAQYQPSIALSVDSPQQVNTREDLRLTVHLRNRNARSYQDDDVLTVRVSSDFFENEYQTSLGPVGDSGEKSAERVVEIDDYRPPGVHPLLVEVIIDNRTVSEQRSEFEIVDFSTVEQEVLIDSSFFKTTTTFNIRNDGNVDANATIAYPSSALSQPFISSSNNYAVAEVDGVRSLVVNQTLAPLEQSSITYVENYRLLVLLFLLIIASGIGYVLLRSPLVLDKEAEHSGDVDEGKSEIKVRLFLKNRSSKTLRNLRVIDRISGMAEVQKQESIGTLKPSKVLKKKGQGTLIRWDLDTLEPFEERIVTYRVHTPLTLVGDVTLPAVKVKFDGDSGRERTAHSQEVVIGRL